MFYSLLFSGSAVFVLTSGISPELTTKFELVELPFEVSDLFHVSVVTKEFEVFKWIISHCITIESFFRRVFDSLREAAGRAVQKKMLNYIDF